ncbi:MULTISPECIES: anti-phage Hailong system effector protein HalA [unclassified Sphingobium]|uniref:anti-phage Hailong system effector protein HalA n=1 Tax=unclassified Sphingobium TaxID=2611147 RepID=UPI0013051570|nr:MULTISPECIES: pentapeptide repeat-containing protein [unclassified Sphingobium]
MNAKVQHIGSRRSQAWWEPTFKPEIDGKLTPCDWDFQTNTGPKRAFLSGEHLPDLAKVGEIQRFNNVTFEDCDIQGYFEHKPSILFDNCRFHGCDFSYSEWRRATFRNCEFKNCSLALTTFEECEFRDCDWDTIGLQGSKTDFIRTFITNPSNLIKSGFSGRNKQAENTLEHACHQMFRLEGTKAHLARTLLYSHEEVGDDETYYQTAKLHDLQQMRAKIAKDFYLLIFGKNFWQRLSGILIIPHIAEMILLVIFGLTNGWGSTILRPVLGLVGSFFIFGCIYSYWDVKEADQYFWQKSFDIATLAGYGNQVNINQSAHLRMVEGTQLLVSILFYTVFFATAVARNSRSR